MQKIFANTFLIILSLITAFVVSEYSVRLLFPSKIKYQAEVDVDYYRYFPRPFVMGAANPYLDHINSLGYRGVLPKMPKPKSEFRVLVFGGSTVFGLDDNQMVDMVQQKINEVRSDVKVYNFGIVSSIYQEDYIRMVVDGVYFQPDLIISYGGGNDLYNPNTPGVPHKFLFLASNPLWRFGVDEYPKWSLFFFGSKLLRLIFTEEFERMFLSLPQDKHFTRDDGYYSDTITHARKTILLMHKLAKAHNSKFMAVLQPLRSHKNPHLNEGIDNSILQGGDRLRDKFYREVSNPLEDEKILDFSTLNLKEPAWWDHIHLNEEGNEMVATMLAKEILLML